MGWLISINNKLTMFSLSVSTLLFASLILFYHVKPRFHVNDLLRNRIREKRIRYSFINSISRKKVLKVYHSLKSVIKSNAKASFTASRHELQKQSPRGIL